MSTSEMPRAARGSHEWVRRSLERELLCRSIYLAAAATVERRVSREAGDWAVVMDIDETAVDNSLLFEELAARDAQLTWTSWTEWVLRREGRPIPGARAFVRRVHELGGKICYLSSRAPSLTDITVEELSRMGLIGADDLVTLLGGSGLRKADQAAQALGAEVSIFAWLGDSLEDFPLGPQGAAQGPWGTEWFLFPNPMYGRWQAVSAQ